MASTEQEPLLAQSSETNLQDDAPSVTPIRRTPLPMKQLLVLCVMRLTEPVSYTLIFPFINQMLEDMKVSEDPKQVGYYAGWIESLFAIAQLCTAIFWGRLSDKVGRKPVMLTGLMGMAISVILFGLQKKYIGLVISRLLAGVMNGNIAILQSIVGEITDSTNFADAAAFLPICFSVGSILGPIIGGCLALPAQQYPAIFGDWSFFIEYPYFLPCFVGGMLNIAAIILGIFFMEESLETKKKAKSLSQQSSQPINYGTCPNPPQADCDAAVRQIAPPSIRSLCTLRVLTVFLTFSIMHLQNISFSAIVPLYSYTKIENCGLGLSLNQIGFMLSTTGFGSIFVQIWVFPPLQRRFGAAKVLQLTLTFFTIPCCLLPLVTFLARLPSASSQKTVLYMSIVLLLRSPGVMCYVCCLMLTNMLAPSSNALGTLNGMSQTCRAFAQTLGPILGTSLYALSISTGILGGNLVWVVMVMISMAAQLCSLMIRDNSGRLY